MNIRIPLLLIAIVTANIAAAENPQVTLQISGAVTGQIVIELVADEAPITVENFINYVQSGFYDGLIFHRVSVSNRVIQGGSFDVNLQPRATGPAIINESSNRLSNVRGTIGMARTSAVDSATSGFFINYGDNTYFDYGYIPFINYPAQVGYCVFGNVVSGMDIVDSIAAVSTTNELPDDDIIIESATITHNVPVCAEKLEGDVDGNCRVNFADFVKMAQNWLACNSLTDACQ